jgi:metallo-beta-lactamase family protein
MSLKVKFVGAVGTVTGSCSLLHYERSDSYYLVDCGLYQGFPGAEERNRRKFPFDPERIAAVLLTHAHIDHCGLLPRLVAEGFRGKVICTNATKQFTLNALEDATGLPGLADLYEGECVARLAELFECPDQEDDFQFGHYYPLDADLFYSFLRNAHIVGSVAVELRINVSAKKSITVTFSGDIGPCTDGKVHGGLQKARQYPNPQTEYLIAESTYGGKSRESDVGEFQHRIGALAAVLKRAFERGSRPVVIFPAYSLQRTQDLIAELHYALCRKPTAETWAAGNARPTVIVDSSMAEAHTGIMYEELLRLNKKGKRTFLNDKSPLFKGLDSDEIDSLLAAWFDKGSSGDEREEGWRLSYGDISPECVSGPVILVCGSGNCLGGRVVKHLAHYLTDPQATVVMTGYQPSGGPGDLLKQLHGLSCTEREQLKLRLGEEVIQGTAIQASVEDLSAYYSGHADENGLMDFILRNDTGKATEPLTVFLNHGDGKARECLKARLESLARSAEPGWRELRHVYLPVAGKGWFDFEIGDWLPDEAKAASSEQIEEMITLLGEMLENQREILALLRKGTPPALTNLEPRNDE